jgi:hypothetical protein
MIYIKIPETIYINHVSEIPPDIYELVLWKNHRDNTNPGSSHRESYELVISRIGGSGWFVSNRELRKLVLEKKVIFLSEKQQKILGGKK